MTVWNAIKPFMTIRVAIIKKNVSIKACIDVETNKETSKRVSIKANGLFKNEKRYLKCFINTI